MGVCVEWIFLLRLCCRSLRNHHVYISYSINGVSACARLSEADWKVKYVCVCVEWSWVPLQTKYRLITPSDLGNEKWNSGFPVGLWACLSYSTSAFQCAFSSSPPVYAASQTRQRIKLSTQFTAGVRLLAHSAKRQIAFYVVKMMEVQKSQFLLSDSST